MRRSRDGATDREPGEDRNRLYIPIMWKPLIEGVGWTSPPLFNFRSTRAALVSRLGAPQATDLDSNGLGPFDAWALAFPCGLEIVVWLFRLRIDGSWERLDDDETADIEIHANERDFDHLRFHLPLDTGEVSRWVSDTLVAVPKVWRVVRQDDNGRCFDVDAFTSRCEAEASAAAFERRGHKQMYWVEPPAALSR